MPIVSDVQVSIAGQPLDAKLMPLLCQVEVQLGVHQQGMMHLEIAAGQNASGDWAPKTAMQMAPGTSFSVDVRIGSSPTRLIHGYLTQSRFNFTAETHDSKFDVTGMDALELVKRNNTYTTRKGGLLGVVRQVLPSDLPLATVDSAAEAQMISEAQSGSDLDFLTALGAKYDRELYVQSTKGGDMVFFQKLLFDGRPAASPPLRINQGPQTNVRNAQFWFDLSNTTRVETNNLDAQGKAQGTPIASDLRDISTLSALERALLAQGKFALTTRLTRESQNTVPELQTRCDSELEKYAWAVVGNGELDTAAYGALLMPRSTVVVMGTGDLFDGTYMVWKITHTFTRDMHCQKFEVRRKLGMSVNGRN